MAEEPSPKRVKIGATTAGEFRVDANEVIKFRFLQHKDGQLQTEFSNRPAPCEPGMCHRFFGDDEEIKGYVGLTVDVWVSMRTFHTWLDVNYDSKRVLADDVTEIFKQNYPLGFSLDKASFLESASGAAIPDLYNLGENISTQQLEDGSEIRVQLHHLLTADSSIRELHARMEPLLLWYIDAASFIEKDDPCWHLLLAVRRHSGMDTVVGFATVYKFWAFPDNTRLRLSQILVLPPFQGQGVGRALLEGAYHMASDPAVQDLTLEDPTPELSRVREKLDAGLMVHLPWLRQRAREAVDGVLSGEEAVELQQLSAEDVARVTQDTKIPRTSVKKLWEAVLRAQPEMDEERVREALQRLVAARLKATYFADLAMRAAGKTLVPGAFDGEFMMARTCLGLTAEAEAGDANGNAVAEEAGTAAEADKKLGELLVERMTRLDELLEAVGGDDEGDDDVDHD